MFDNFHIEHLPTNKSEEENKRKTKQGSTIALGANSTIKYQH